MDTLFVSDLDGTLLTPQSIISSRSLSILNALIERGVPFTCATARSYSSAGKVIAGLHLRMDMIVYNGAMLADPLTGKTSEIIALESNIINGVRRAIDDFNPPLPFVYSIIDGEERVSYVSGAVNKPMARYIASRRGDERFRALNGPQQLFDGDVFYVTFIGQKARLAEAYDAMRVLPCNVLLQKDLGVDDEYWLEIMPIRATKAAAIERIKARLGFKRVVCFGDYLNDASMFAIADESYAVANAADELKMMATQTIGANYDDGVAEFMLSRFLNR